MRNAPTSREQIEPTDLEERCDVESDEEAAVGLVTTQQAAKMLGISARTMATRAQELGARSGKRGQFFFEVERVRMARAGGGVRKTNQFESFEGERDARVISSLDAGTAITKIVAQHRVPLHVVMRLREEWLKAHAVEREGVVFVCACGAPSNLHTAHCDRCAAKTQVLTEEQRAVLAGHPLEPGETVCTACGDRHAVDALDRFCASCRGHITIVVEGSGAKIVMQTKRRAVVLYEVPREALLRIAQIFAPPASSMRTAPLEAPLSPAAAGSSITAQVNIMKEQVEAVERDLAEAVAKFEKENS